MALLRQKLRRRLKMMAVILRTDFIQGQFAFKTKKNSGSYKTHQAPTKKIVSFSETLRKCMCKFTEKGPEICL